MTSVLDLSSFPIRISEPHTHKSFLKFVVSFVGLISVGATIGIFGESLGGNILDTGQGVLMAFFLSFAVLGFGISALLAWRQKVETQEIRLDKNFVEVRSSLLKTPLFHSPISATKVQRFQLPGGRQQIFLRSEEKALEIGHNLEEEQQNKLAQHLENLLGSHAPLGFSRKPT